MNNNTERLQPVTSIEDLCSKAMSSRRYGGPLLATARKLGSEPDNLREARSWLELLASQDGERAVLDVANALLDQV